MRGHAEVKVVLQGAEEIHLTPVVWASSFAGFFKGKNRLKNERELQAFLESPRVNVANVDGETARRYPRLSVWEADVLPAEPVLLVAQ